MRGAPLPEIRYAHSGDVAIAYQLTGVGPPDLVFVPTFSNLVYPWWHVGSGASISDSRCLRGSSCSTSAAPGSRTVRATSARSKRGSTTFAPFSTPPARRGRRCSGRAKGDKSAPSLPRPIPERTRGTDPYGTPARAFELPTIRSGRRLTSGTRTCARCASTGVSVTTSSRQARDAFGSAADDEVVEWFVECQRFCASPAPPSPSSAAMGRRTFATCFLHSRADPRSATVTGTATSHSTLPGVSQELRPWSCRETFRNFVIGDVSTEIERFILGASRDQLPDRVLTTVLFTDIAGSTEQALSLGDSAWTELLARHRAAVRSRPRPLPGHRGRYGRRWVLRHLRRPSSGDPLRP